MTETKTEYRVSTKRTVCPWICDSCGAAMGHVVEVDGVRRLRAGDVFLEGQGHVRCKVCLRWKKWYDGG